MPRYQSRRSSVRHVVRRAMLPAIAIIIVGAFGAYAILGQNGARAYGEVKREQARQEARLKALKKKHAEWQNKVDLLDPQGADQDMVDELARKKLNVAHPDEVIVPVE